MYASQELPILYGMRTCRDFVKTGWRMGTCVRQSKDAFLNVNVDKSKQGRTLVFRGLLGLVKDRDLSIFWRVVFRRKFTICFRSCNIKLRHYVTSSTKVDPEFVRKLI